MKPYLGRGDRKRKTEHAGAQVAGMPFGNAGDQVGGASQGQRGRKAADDGGDIAFQPERLQGFVDRPLVQAPGARKGRAGRPHSGLA